MKQGLLIGFVALALLILLHTDNIILVTGAFIGFVIYKLFWRFRQTRLERLRANGGRHTQAEWVALCIRYNYQCLACGQRKKLTKDHIKPVSRGGNDSIRNIQPLCFDCNRRKGTKHIDYRKRWYQLWP